MSDKDRNKIYELAFSLGFESIEMVCACIGGNEIALGLSLPVKEQEKADQMKQNMDRFAYAIPTKSGVILGKNFYIESCFNIEGYTKDYFKSFFDRDKNKLLNSLKQINEADSGLSDKIYDLTIKIEGNIKDRIINFADFLKLPKNVCDAVLAGCETMIDAPLLVYTTAMTELDKVDQNLEQSYYQKKLDKDTRQRWRINGRGIDGAIVSAVTESLLDAGTALAYDAMNAIEIDKEEKDSASRRKKILDTVKDFIIKEYSVYEDNIPLLFLGHIEEEYPYSVWSKDYHGYAARDELVKRFDYAGIKYGQLSDTELLDYLKMFRDDKKAKRKIVKRVSQQKDFDKVLGELRLLVSLNMGDVSPAFEFFVHRITHSDFTLERQCKELRAFETRFDYMQGSVQNEIYGSYIESCIISDNMKLYDPAVIKGVYDNLKSFSKKYKYNTDKYQKRIQKDVFALKKFDLESKDQGVLKENIEKLETISNDLNWDLSNKIAGQKQRIENLELQRIQEEERQKAELEKRKVDIYTDYDITKNAFDSKRITADSLEAKEQIEADKKKISAECKKLSLDMTKESFNGIIGDISVYNTTKSFDLLIENLKKKWALIEKHQNDVKKELINKYGSEENVRKLKEEEAAALSIFNNEWMTETEKYVELYAMNCTVYDIQDILEKQQQRLLKRIEMLEDNINKGSGIEIPMLHYIGDFIPIKCIIATVIGIIAFLYFSSLLLKILDVLIVTGMWGMFFENAKDAKNMIKRDKGLIKEKKEALKPEKEELDHFRDLFDVVNGCIVPKQ